MNSAPQTVREGLFFGEGPRWHAGRLWYSDFYDRAVHSMDETGRDQRVVDVPAQPSGLGWLPDGRLLVVAMKDRKVLRLEEDGSLAVHADLSAAEPFMNNDMVVDAEGRAYVGGFGFDLDALLASPNGLADPGPTPTVLSRIDPDGTVSLAASDLMFPNGTVITDGGSTLVVAETMAQRLTAFDRDADGTLSNRRVWADLSGTGAVPDGICLDADGAIWIADPLSPRCLRIAEGGAVLATAEFSQPCFACALGGTDELTLYALTAPSSNAIEAAAAPKGKIEALRVEVPGAGSP